MGPSRIESEKEGREYVGDFDVLEGIDLDHLCPKDALFEYDQGLVSLYIP
jgi:hypothetical protein